MDILAGFLLITYGVIGSFKATALLRRERLPAVDCGIMAMLGLVLVLGGLALLLRAPVGLPLIALLATWRGLAIYNAKLLKGRSSRRDLWPGAAPELALSTVIVLSML